MEDRSATRFPWQLFVSELIGTSLLVLVGLSLVILMFGTGSPIVRVVPSEGARRLITGFLFGSTGALIALSPVGRESGAHLNPVVTLGFWLMGKMKSRVAVGYVLAHLTGACLGSLPLLAWARSMGRCVAFGATLPGAGYGVTEIFNVFRVSELMQDEEATLVKMLEVVKDFEGAGYNSRRDFLGVADDGTASGTEWTMNIPKNMDAVHVMTVHKAKGLGFPAVLILLYEERSKRFDYIVAEDEAGVCLLKITKEELDCSPEFEGLYREEMIKDRVNRLNSLYVGFTRPEEELYVIGVKGKRDGYPFDLLPLHDYPPSARPDRRLVGDAHTPDHLSVAADGSCVIRPRLNTIHLGHRSGEIPARPLFERGVSGDFRGAGATSSFKSTVLRLGCCSPG